MYQYTAQWPAGAWVVLPTLLLGLWPLPTPAATEAVYSKPLYLNAERSVEERVEDLLARMTTLEKVGQMALVESQSLKQLSDIDTYKLGGILSGAGAKPATNTPAGWADHVAQHQAVARATRLGIPLLYGADAVHGQGHVEGLTVFPHAIGQAATRDASLVEAIAIATTKEVAATGVNWNYAPNLDLPLDTRWGRVYETYGSSRAVASALGAAAVRGTQYALGTSSAYSILATPKHYVGLGSMGFRTSSNANFLIDQGVTPIDRTLLRDYYLPPFRAAIDAGALSIMAGLNSWGTQKVSASRYLLTDVLKDDLGFTGFVVSDWYGVYEIPGTKYSAMVKAINAGIDMVMLPFDYEEFVVNMLKAHRFGHISSARIDDAVRRILRAKITAGLFTAYAAPVIDPALLVQHRTLAREAVAASAVLLKNEGSVLPLPRATSAPDTILVAGSAADNTGHQAGGWTVEWQGVSGNVVAGATSILAGIQATVGSSTTVTHVADMATLATTTRATVGIAVVGEAPYAEGWGDREYPILPASDIETITRLRAQVDQLVVVVVSGRPLLMEQEWPYIDAVVAVWLPGTAGEGVADVLFGVQPITGRLPIGWPMRAKELPFRPNGRAADNALLRYPPGYGLQTNVTFSP